MKIRVAGIVRESFTDGEGIRTAVYFQGCLHGCPGCHNPQTHNMTGGIEYTVDDVVNILKDDKLSSGVTLTGGDPLFQPSACMDLIHKIRAELPQKDIWLYTGYTYESLHGELKDIVNNVDVIVDGRFVEPLKSLDLIHKGSSNQRIIDINATKEAKEIILLYE